ncbi:pentatricopeptide repeat-containing protein At3g09040, mitochondrial-like [Vicia villosa]|uniref:pentatricopeptide repeat-containing protein At3g09040, mitochondrial-like n=1 Tax=Vicia villosa TaxID=3911 RepID=UPI00273CDEC1|nr:pentatricopeptide repeat-containing protein At3g09040, mitochondrial-like [Vicia villosa]
MHITASLRVNYMLRTTTHHSHFITHSPTSQFFHQIPKLFHSNNQHNNATYHLPFETITTNSNSLISTYSRQSLFQKVLQTYTTLINSSQQPNQSTFSTTLQSCTKLENLEFGKLVHTSIIKNGFESDPLIHRNLIHFYTKCKCMTSARTLFDSALESNLLHLDTPSLTALISGYVNVGLYEEALHVFDEMRSGFVLDELAYVTVLNACVSLGKMDYARELFDEMGGCENVVVWNVMISGHGKRGYYKEAVEFYREMRKNGVGSSRSTLASVLSAIAGLGELDYGLLVHGEGIKLGLESSVYVVSSLVNMYGKCGRLGDAKKVFDVVCERNVVTWNTILGVYASNGCLSDVMELFTEMMGCGIDPDEFTYSSILSSCACFEFLEIGRQMHSTIIKKRFTDNLCVNNALVDMYAKAGALKEARKQFEQMKYRDNISWNAILVGYVQEEEETNAFNMFRRMNRLGVVPDEVSMASILSACGNIKALEAGLQFHSLSVKLGLETNLFAGSSLIDMYSKCGGIKDARKVYSTMPEWSVVSMNALIAGYALKDTKEAINLLHEMQVLGLNPSEITFASLIDCCKEPPKVILGMQLHCAILKKGLLCGSEFLGTSLLGMYMDSQRMEDANILFSELSNLKSIVLWTALISGHTQSDCSDEALKLYRKMRDNNILPDQATFVTVLRACALLSSLQDGKEMHSLIFHTGFDLDELTSSALVDMYAKCGDVESAAKVFKELAVKKDAISWNSMIVGFAKNGYAERALNVFDQMTQSNVAPDDVTFLGVLTACSHAGLVSEGRRIFDNMVNYYGICPRVDHYACMVDLLGRWGFLEEAEGFIDKLDVEPNAMIWANLLGACRIHGDEKRGQKAAEKLIELEPQNSSPYVLLSNMYAASGHWDEARSLRRTMIQREIQKMPGCSWIVIGQNTNSFVAGDLSHPSSDEISHALKHLTALTRDNRLQEGGISHSGQVC